MIITPRNPESYARLLQPFKEEQAQTNIPKDQRSYIERHNQPPISAFLNVSIRNHQNFLTRVGHVSLSLLTPIQLDILAWYSEQSDKSAAMATLRDSLTLDLVHVAETRTLPKRQKVLETS